MTHILHINHCYFVTHRLRKRDFIRINQKNGDNKTKLEKLKMYRK